MPAKKPKPDEKPQSERFIDAAREAGASEDPKDFERAFEKVIGGIPAKPSRPMVPRDPKQRSR